MPSWYVMIAHTPGVAVAYRAWALLFILVTGSFRNLSIGNKQNKAPRFCMYNGWLESPLNKKQLLPC